LLATARSISIATAATLFRLHGATEPESIGQAVFSR